MIVSSCCSFVKLCSSQLCCPNYFRLIGKYWNQVRNMIAVHNTLAGWQTSPKWPILREFLMTCLTVSADYRDTQQLHKLEIELQRLIQQTCTTCSMVDKHADPILWLTNMQTIFYDWQTCRPCLLFVWPKCCIFCKCADKYMIMF